MSRPVLLTVDDDPAVGRALARDLRRRYAEDYRGVRAEDEESGARRTVERRHGGSIDVDTGPAGTTFPVRLPLRH